MSKKGSVFQKGGGGTNFEQAVQTAFLTTLMIQGNAPAIPSNKVVEIAFQVTNRGYETDDLLIIAESALDKHCLLAQIKYNLTFSSNNDTFNEVISSFWIDFNNTTHFDKTKDRLLIIKSSLTKDEKNHLKSIISWAKTHAATDDFISEVQRIKGKQKYLDFFKESLTIANNDNPVSNQQVWEFLKCFDILEYDFLQSGSLAKTHFLNLIKLTKSPACSLNESQIWDSLLAYVANSNKDGGSVNTQSIRELPCYQYFETGKLNPHFQSVEKLKNDSKILFENIKNTIHGYHLKRQSARNDIFTSVNQKQITLISGKPGVGKTAIVKDLIEYDFTNAVCFFFKADEFNVTHLSQLLSNHGIHESIQDIFSCLSLIPDKVIVIDSMEKLLEGDPDNAFRQFLTILQSYSNIKLIGTIRKYAVDLIYQKFGLDSQNSALKYIPVLNEAEQSELINNFPEIGHIFKNKKVKSLLEIPKYLDFILTAVKKSSVDFTKINLTEFKNQLWNVLVKNSSNRKNGLPSKREKAFIEIALTRAKKMSLFISPVSADEEAVDFLEDDEIIIQENQTGKYSPSHDILEDWALMKYVSSVYETNPNPSNFFNNLGSEPAIRRAFRLWVSDNLIDDNIKITTLLKQSLSNEKIENYWSDELIIAIFKSQNCRHFFTTFTEELLANNAELLNRCLHLLRTACKVNVEKHQALVPAGSGWTEAVFFIEKNIHSLNSNRNLICNFLFDWESKLYNISSSTVNQDEKIAVRNIISHYIKEIENEEEVWFSKPLEEKREALISLLFLITDIAKNEIKTLILNAENRKIKGKWHLRKFYEKIIEMTLSGINTLRLSKELPDLIIETAWKYWKLNLKKIEKRNTRSFKSYGFIPSLRDEECWGINPNHRFFPSGIYKTPAYNLLRTHPIEGLKFIVDFINYSVDFYAKTDFDYKQDLEEITIKFHTGKSIKKWGNAALWLAYRGTSVTNYAIESLLMSLEKFLFNLAKTDTIYAEKNLQFAFEYLLGNSNNVTTTSLITSVLMAYPKTMSETVIPIFGIQQFYSWDIGRVTNEHSALAPMDSRISFAQEERYKSNQLPHRKKYKSGLKDFILDYQFSIATLNQEIFQLFDELKENAEDIFWKKMLNEIDRRDWTNIEDDRENNRLIIQPEYDPEIKEQVETNQKEYAEESKLQNDGWLIKQVYEGKETIDFEKWEQVFEQYSQKEAFNFYHDWPVSLAFIGLNTFKEKLLSNQKTWCIDLLTKVISTILASTFRVNSLQLDFSLNPMEKETAFSSFHLLLDNIETNDKKQEVISLCIYTLFAPFPNYEIVKILEYFRETFYVKNPEVFNIIWKGLIEYAKYRKANPYYYDAYQQEELAEKRKAEAAFINDFIANPITKIQIKDISFDDFENHLIPKIAMLTPFDGSKVYTQFLEHFISLLEADLKINVRNYSEKKIKRKIHHDLVYSFRDYLIQLFLHANVALLKNIFDLLVNPVHDKSFDYRKHHDYSNYVLRMLEQLICKLYTAIADSKDEDYNNRLISNFWALWEYLFQRIDVTPKIRATS